ncbi:MAG: hypothetical protein A2Y40_07875 [Candidatus Margulisbacteria bacterium GWF2_35_9]|nr:MAG: hypothetical protein A2Y40_07875 [Candidatus Margulisbacteria bacterium GWF2_35_9]
MDIIIVDDELVARKKLTEILKQFGDCHEFPEGNSAITYFGNMLRDKKKIGLITLDISMPSASGITVLHRLRVLERISGIIPTQQTPILMVTANTDKSKVNKALSLGCTDYILKPFDEVTILARLKKHNIIH